MGHLRILLPNQLVIERLITLCRVTRHYKTTKSHEHGSPAETKPAPAFHAHRPNTRLAKPIQGHKLYSKVLTI